MLGWEENRFHFTQDINVAVAFKQVYSRRMRIRRSQFLRHLGIFTNYGGNASKSLTLK